MQTDQTSLASALAAADTGPVLTGQLYPLNNVGRLRVTYNWLYSALNSDPSDTSDFGWVISKTGSGAVSLSPAQPYNGMTLYASVRPDYSYQVQVQAPFSADWITAVGGDEELTLGDEGLMIITLQGLNGLYLGADASQTQHDDHSGYLFHSSAAQPGPASKFFLAVTGVLQPAVSVALADTLSTATVEAALASQGASDAATLAQQIVTQ
jgi:hypothetical protein